MSPRSEKRCLPPKTALIQIKLNEVSLVNPCVFQLLKHPHLPLRMSASGPLSTVPALKLPDSQSLTETTAGRPQTFCPAAMCVCVCVYIWKYMLYCKFVLHFSLSDLDRVYSLLLVLPVFLPVHLFKKKMYFCLQLAYACQPLFLFLLLFVVIFFSIFAVKYKIQSMQMFTSLRRRVEK